MNQATAQSDHKVTITYGNQSVERSSKEGLHEAFDKLGNVIKSYIKRNIDKPPSELINTVRSFADIKSEKQMAIINPQNFCNAWFAIKDFINKDTDIKKAVMLVSFKNEIMEITGTDGYSLAVCQIKAETNIEGTFALSIRGNSYDEFNAFIIALYSGIKGKDRTQITQLLSFEINETMATLNIYEPTLFENEPSLQINLKLLENKDIIPYKRVICNARECEVNNTFCVNLEILQRVQKAISKLTKQSIVKVMQSGNSYVIVPCTTIDDCEVYYTIMGMGGNIKISDFAFESIQEDQKIEEFNITVNTAE